VGTVRINSWKFILSWLRDHLDTNASVDEIAYALTDLGLEAA
jgi:phenylalanyl-tRNA synthetase beta chain